jgi:hypothetical protein
MSDDEEYYEYEEDFMYEDLVPDMVVSATFHPIWLSNQCILSCHVKYQCKQFA